VNRDLLRERLGFRLARRIGKLLSEGNPARILGGTLTGIGLLLCLLASGDRAPHFPRELPFGIPKIQVGHRGKLTQVQILRMQLRSRGKEQEESEKAGIQMLHSERLKKKRVDEPIQFSTLDLEIFDLNSQEEYSDF
jgi:hypothetical protein